MAASSTTKYGSKDRHPFMNLYQQTFPLAAIFLLDILPSRLSLIIVGHVTNGDHYAFSSIFLAYSFTNFFSVFVLSLSCGLDTLTKTQLRNISYLRYALVLVALGLIPYVICCVWSPQILAGLNQPVEIIASTSTCITYLIVYSMCYIMFAMLRKSLLQYLHTSLLIGFMFARLCIHLMIGYALFYYTNLGFYSFLISDSVSMLSLLLVTIGTLSRMVDLGKTLQALLRFSAGASGSERRSIMSATSLDDEDDNTMVSPPQQVSYLKQYVAATLVPGTISCLEWWAVESFTFLVGGLVFTDHTTSKLAVFFVHCCWASLLLILQMPMLGLSVAMAAIMTADIRSGRFYPAWYTFLQSLASVVVYCVCVTLFICFLASDKVISIFYPLSDKDNVSEMFSQQVISFSSQIKPLFIIAVCGYSIAMCFLGIFVSVGRLARGGTFMLIGYYVFGLILAVMLGYVVEWNFYGIWFGQAGAFLVWCLLCALYWSCTDWFVEMHDMKQQYQTLDRKEKGSRHVTDYGATH